MLGMFDNKYRNKRITRFAKGQPCTLRLPGVCDGGGATSVWAHSNLLRHGKGRGTKAHDIFGCVACYQCHEVLDERVSSSWTADELDNEFQRAHEESLLMLLDQGVIA